MGELVALAKEALKEKLGDLWPSETELLDCVEKGEPKDYREHEKEKDDPANAKAWGEHRTLRAGVINWLGKDKRALHLITCRGIEIGGAKIIGRINLAYTIMNYPLTLAFCSIPNGINIGYARVDFLALDGSHVAHEGKPDDASFHGDGLVIRSNVYFRDGAIFKGRTRLLGAEIGSQLNCRKSSFIAPASEAFNADGIRVKGSVILRDGAEFHGMTRLLGANIDGDVDCSGSCFINRNGKAFAADDATVKGKVVFGNGAKFYGETRITGAEIGTELSCRGSSFINPTLIAFFGDRVKVHGSAFLDNGATFEGQTNLSSAQIESTLALDTSKFNNEGAVALMLQGIIVKQHLFLNDISEIKGMVILTDATVNIIKDDEKYWNSASDVLLKGFTYNRIQSDADLLHPKTRLKWLYKHSKVYDDPQPYIQLADYYRKLGKKKASRKVLIALNQVALNRRGQFVKIISFPINILFGYGYRIWPALILSALIIILIGSIEFNNANRVGLMIPVKIVRSANEMSQQSTLENLDYPTFNSLFYSLDAFLPLVDLHQESHWLPKSDIGGARCVWRYMLFHIIMGWILTTMIVAAISGLIRREEP
jgi:hypothetical protein